MFTWGLIKAPLTGAANAQQLTDTATGYAISKFMSQADMNSLVFLVAVIFLAVIWLSLPFKNTDKSN
jgi:hypothetical protein